MKNIEKSLGRQDGGLSGEQFAFVYSRPRHESPDITVLLSFLDGRSWTASRRIKEVLGWPERKTRAIAHASKGRIISSDHGYKLTNASTVEEVTHATRRLQSQARTMLKRVIEIERVRHEKAS